FERTVVAVGGNRTVVNRVGSGLQLLVVAVAGLEHLLAPYHAGGIDTAQRRGALLVLVAVLVLVLVLVRGVQERTVGREAGGVDACRVDVQVILFVSAELQRKIP